MNEIESRNTATQAAKPVQSSVMSEVHAMRSRKSVLVGVHFPQSAIDALDSYIEADFNEIKRPEAIRQIVKRWLVDNGYYRK